MERRKPVLVDEVLVNVVGRHREGSCSLVGFAKLEVVVLWVRRRVHTGSWSSRGGNLEGAREK